jgi:hypothetical protein
MILESLDHLQYNTERNALIIPENGRHFQQMVDHAMQIEDREERNKVAQSIVDIMGNRQKLWDQLFIMSGFALDVDAPFPKPSAELLAQRPEVLPYPQNFPKYRFYGNNIKRMIDVAVAWDDAEKREGFAYVIANHMKKCYLNWNKDTVDDQAIFDHLEELSEGVLKLTSQEDKLTDSEEILKNRINRPAKPQARKNHRNNRSKKK